MNLKKKLICLLQLIVTIVLLYLIFHKYDLSFSEHKINFKAPIWFIFPIYFSLILIPLLAAARWKVFLFLSGIKADFYQLLKINFSSIFWGTFLPSSDGFAAIRLYQIERSNAAKPGFASSSIILEKSFGFVVLCLLGFGFSFFIQDFARIMTIRLFLAFICFVIICLLFILSKTSIIYYFTARIGDSKVGGKIVDFMQNVIVGIKRVNLGKALFSSLPLILMIQLTTFLNVYLIFKILGENISLIQVLAFMPIIHIISLIPATISGFGLREGAFIYFFSQSGMLPEIAFAASLINFAILTGIPAVIGGFISLYYQLSGKR